MIPGNGVLDHHRSFTSYMFKTNSTWNTIGSHCGLDRMAVGFTTTFVPICN